MLLNDKSADNMLFDELWRIGSSPEGIPNQFTRNNEQARLNEFKKPNLIDPACEVGSQEGPNQCHGYQSSSLQKIILAVGTEILIWNNFGQVNDGKQDRGSSSKLRFRQLLWQHINLKWWPTCMRDKTGEAGQTSPKIPFQLTSKLRHLRLISA